MRYFVTGASGFIGRCLLDHLAEHADFVRGQVIEPEAVELLRRPNVEVVVANLQGDRALWEEHIRGMDVVIHLAGVIPAERHHDSGRTWRINVEGTARLLACSMQAGIKRFVFLSSTAVYGFDDAAALPIDEAAPKHPRGLYAESKWAAEQLVWRSFEKDHLPVTVLRPTVIYGPGDLKFSVWLLQLLRLPVLPFPSGGNRLIDMVYVTDVVAAIEAAATAPAAIGNAYNITDGARHTIRDVVLKCGKVQGRNPAILPIPSALFAPLRWLEERFEQNRNSPKWLDRLQLLGWLDFDRHYAIDAAHRDLGFTPQVNLENGLRMTLAWLSERATVQSESGSGASV